MFDGKVIDMQWKRRRRNTNVDEYIRSYDNGWVFTREGIGKYYEEQQKVKTQGLLAVKALGLDFGASDVIYSEKHRKATVLEVNTSPGLEGTSVQLYADAIRRYRDEAFGLRRP